MVPSREELIRIGQIFQLSNEKLNGLLSLASYHDFTESEEIPKPKKQRLTFSKDRVSKEFNTQLEDLKNIVESLETKIGDSTPDKDELKNQLEELQTTVKDLSKKGATLSAPVKLPSSQKMAVKLVPTNTFDTLEEYRADQNKWFSVCTLFLGAIFGIFINLITGATADKATWIVLGLLVIITAFSGHSGWVYSKRSKDLKDSIEDMYSTD
jgi:hypothetical protein